MDSKVLLELLGIEKCAHSANYAMNNANNFLNCLYRCLIHSFLVWIYNIMYYLQVTNHSFAPIEKLFIKYTIFRGNKIFCSTLDPSLN